MNNLNFSSRIAIFEGKKIKSIASFLTQCPAGTHSINTEMMKGKINIGGLCTHSVNVQKNYC